jgi:hypothetical protein
MAKPWSEVVGSAGFMALNGEQQDEARRQYFDGVVAPRVPSLEREAAWEQFSFASGYSGALAAPKHREVPDATVGSVARDIAAGALQIGPTAIKGVADIARLATGDRVGKDTSEYLERGMDAIRETVGSERAAAQRENFQRDMADDEVGIGEALMRNKGALADQILPTVGSMFLPVGAAGLAGKAAMAGQAAKALDATALAARVAAAQKAAGVGAVAAQNAADTFSGLLEKGMSLQDAYLGAGITVPFSVIAGKLTGGGAEVAAARALTGTGAVKVGAKQIAKAAGQEGAQEAGEQLGQITGEAVATGETPSAVSAGKQLAVAGTLGAVMGGGVDVATQVGQRRQPDAGQPEVDIKTTHRDGKTTTTRRDANGNIVTDVTHRDANGNPVIEVPVTEVVPGGAAQPQVGRPDAGQPEAAPLADLAAGPPTAAMDEITRLESAQDAATAAQRLAELEVIASSEGLNPEQQAERDALAQRVEGQAARAAELEAVGESAESLENSAPVLDQQGKVAIKSGANEAADAAPAFNPAAVQAKTFPQFQLERGFKPHEMRRGTPEWDTLLGEWAAVKTARAGTNPEGTGAVGTPTPEIQNRDRSRPASVVQMQGMAQNPDYMRLGVSRSPESGAPMVFTVGDQAHAAHALGRGDTAVMSDGQRVPFQYAVMEAADVQPSNFADGAVNPLFDAAHPGTVKALNNGRTAGLRAAYERGTAEAYKQELMADSAMHGIDPEVIAGMRAPMLVRLYSERENQANMGAKSQSQALGLSAAEQASTDAALVDAGVLEVFEAGGLDSAANRDFARAFIGKLQEQGQDVAGMMDAGGALSPAGVTRLQAALVHKAYGDGDLVETMFGSTDSDIRAIGEALKDVAGEWANLRAAAEAGAVNPQVDVTGNLLQAIRMVQKARRERASLYDAIQQVDMVTGDVPDALTLGMLRLLYSGHYLTRPVGRDRLIESLRQYLGAALATRAEGDMFGEQVGPAEILAALGGQPTPSTTHDQPRTEPARQPDPAQGGGQPTGSDPAGGRADESGGEAWGQEPDRAGQATADAGGRGQGQDAHDPARQQDGQGDQGVGEDGRGEVAQEAPAFSRGPRKPEDFIPAPDGGLDYGEITPEMSKAMRRQSAPIRLRQGNDGSGLKHIGRSDRLQQIHAAGYEDVADFVGDVARNFDAVHKGRGSSLFLVKKTDRPNRTLVVQLEAGTDGDFYDVKTALVSRPDFMNGKELLWERAQSNRSESETPSAVSGQSNDASVSPQDGNAKFDASNPDIRFNRQAGEDAGADFDVDSFLAAMEQGQPTQQELEEAVQKARATADSIRSAWANGPEVVVAFDMSDPVIPQAVREDDLAQKSRGAQGEPEGFFYEGRVYLLASQLPTQRDVARVLFHEALGHHGLRGMFGGQLDGILQQIVVARRGDVAKKAAAYGLDMDKVQDRMKAAEEVLAEMAEKTPQLGFVRRAVAAVRAFLRANVPGFAGMRVSDDEIVRDYILPARGWVERGAQPAPGAAQRGRNQALELAFSLAPDALAQARARWSSLVDQFVRGGLDETKTYEVLPSSTAVMKMVGLPDLPIHAGVHALDALYNHGVKPSQMKRVLDELADPCMVMIWNKGRGGEISLNFVTSMRNGKGEPFVIGLKPNRGGRQQRYHWLATVTEKQPSAILGMVRDGGAVYVGEGEIAGVSGQDMREALRYAKEKRGKEARDLKAVMASKDSLPNLVQRTLYAKDLDAFKEAARTQSGGAPVYSRGGNADSDIAPWEQAQLSGLQAKADRVIYEMQDGRIDLKRTQEAIEQSGREIDERFDARLAETLLPGRVAYRTQTFLEREAMPVQRVMARLKVSQAELGDYLHARAAPERNAQIAKVNPEMPDGGAGSNSQGLLLTTAAAEKYIADIPVARRRQLEELAAKVDAITKGTRDLLVAEGLETAETIAAWEGAYKNYVPMFREDVELGSSGGVGAAASKRATGSEKQALDIWSNILLQRENAIGQAESNRFKVSLYGLALSNPNPDLWVTIRPASQAKQIAQDLQNMGVDPAVAEAGMQGVPTIRTVDPMTNQVVDRVNPMYKNLPGAMTLKVNGEVRVLMFNEKNERAMRMVAALKGTDGLTNFDLASSAVGKTTRWLAAVNTQYNPAFGVVNFVRDTLGGAINLSSTALRGNSLRLLGQVPDAMVGIAQALIGKHDSEWSKAFTQFQADGGQTGFREMFKSSGDRAARVEQQLALLEKEGRLTPANAARVTMKLLDGFNTVLENAVRLSAYKLALDKGISRPEAARLARELTVDFNRKGRMGRELGPLYAFLNASLQGTERTIRALRGPDGVKIIAGGLAMGVIQALMLAMAGFDDDELQEFTKARAFIIPLFTDNKRYAAIPLPLGLHVLPNTGRVLTELVIGDHKDAGKRVFDAAGEIAGALNPLGGGNVFTMDGLLRTVAPTVADPFIELGFNKNFAGSQIEKEPVGGDKDARPGYSRARESTLRSTTGQMYLGISKALNWLSGGSEHEAGVVSPTPERVRYIAQTAGGGVLRELEKIINTSTAAARGEEVKVAQVPLVSRFGGRVDADRVAQSRYFDNVRRLERTENTLNAAKRAGDGEFMVRLLEERPEAELIKFGNKVQAEIAKLNKQAVSIVGDREALQQVDQDRLERMRALNDAVRNLELVKQGPTLAQRVRGEGSSHAAGSGQ